MACTHIRSITRRINVETIVLLVIGVFHAFAFVANLAQVGRPQEPMTDSTIAAGGLLAGLITVALFIIAL